MTLSFESHAIRQMTFSALENLEVVVVCVIQAFDSLKYKTRSACTTLAPLIHRIALQGTGTM